MLYRIRLNFKSSNLSNSCFSMFKVKNFFVAPHTYVSLLLRVGKAYSLVIKCKIFAQSRYGPAKLGLSDRQKTCGISLMSLLSLRLRPVMVLIHSLNICRYLNFDSGLTYSLSLSLSLSLCLSLSLSFSLTPLSQSIYLSLYL